MHELSRCICGKPYFYLWTPFPENQTILSHWNKNPGPWWFLHGVHHYPCTNGKKVKEFNAKKYCTSEGCGLCLSTDYDGLGGACPGEAAPGSMTNLRNFMPFLFEEMPCLWPNPLIDAAPPVAQKAVFEAAAASGYR
ncbi:hypothetical protein N7488_009750 [Penicillium malachiteum]|nr:hypothetical protein N7488_009750 [Penicillium malachiteum]